MNSLKFLQAYMHLEEAVKNVEEAKKWLDDELSLSIWDCSVDAEKIHDDTDKILKLLRSHMDFIDGADKA